MSSIFDLEDAVAPDAKPRRMIENLHVENAKRTLAVAAAIAAA